MKKVKWIFFLFLSSLFVSCATANFGPTGLIFTKATFPVYATKPSNSKKAESCVHSLFSLVSWGGASVSDITKKAGITNINNITYETFSLLIYGNLCVVIEGD